MTKPLVVSIAHSLGKDEARINRQFFWPTRETAFADRQSGGAQKSPSHTRLAECGGFILSSMFMRF